MLNNEKIVLMTKLALYEQGEGKKKIPISRYYKSDYIGMRLLSSFLYINLALAICAVLWVLAQGKSIIENIAQFNIGKQITAAAIIYVVVVIVYMVFSYVFYTYKFKSTRRSLKEYNSQLKELHKIQERELEAITETDTNIVIGGGDLE